MNIEQVSRLLDAGFTKEEIMNFVQEPSPVKEPVPEPVQDPVPEAVQEPVTEQTPADELGVVPHPEYEKLTESIDKLIRTIQSSNLRNNFSDSTGQKIDIDKEVDKIMSTIIRPEKKGD